MLGFGAIAEFAIADDSRSTGLPLVLSLPSFEIGFGYTILDLRAGRSVELGPAALSFAAATIGLRAGRQLGLTKSAIVFDARPPGALTGRMLGLPPAGMDFLSPALDVQAGRVFNLSRQIVRDIDIHSIASSAIGEFAIGEGEPFSVTYTTPVRFMFNSRTLRPLPGKNFNIPPLDATLAAPPPELEARERRIRVGAIVS